MMANSKTQEFCGGEILLWAEYGEPIMLKNCERHGDPVELSADEARQLASALLKLADWCDKD